MNEIATPIPRDGQVILAEQPAGVTEAEVLVTFLNGKPAAAGQPMRFGQFAGERMSTEEDFRIAEWREEAADRE